MIGSMYGKFSKSTVFLQSIILLAVRLIFGIQTAQSGFSHLHHIPDMIGNFKDWGVPFPTASVYVSGWSELVLGSMLVLGLGTRLISLPLVFNFIVAIIAVSRHDLWDELSTQHFSKAYDVLLKDTAFPFLIATLITMAFGAGIFALDPLFGRVLFSAPKKKD